MIKWRHSAETLSFFLQINLILLPAFGFPYALYLFTSAPLLFSLVRKTIAPLLQGTQRWKNAILFLYNFLGCFHFGDSFLTSPVAGFCASASHLIINIFLRILAAVQRRWRFWTPPPQDRFCPTVWFWLTGWVGGQRGRNEATRDQLEPRAGPTAAPAWWLLPAPESPQQSGSGIWSDATAVKQRAGLKNTDLSLEYENCQV